VALGRSRQALRTPRPAPIAATSSSDGLSPLNPSLRCHSIAPRRRKPSWSNAPVSVSEVRLELRRRPLHARRRRTDDPFAEIQVLLKREGGEESKIPRLGSGHCASVALSLEPNGARIKGRLLDWHRVGRGFVGVGAPAGDPLWLSRQRCAGGAGQRDQSRSSPRNDQSAFENRLRMSSATT